MERPWLYLLALLAKAIPHLGPSRITLKLRGGGFIPVRELMTLYIYKEIFIEGYYDLELPRDARILDIGANTGLFDLRMKRLYPDSVIHAYEPMPGVFAQLRETASQLSGITYSKPDLRRRRQAKLYVHSRNIAGHSLYEGLANGAGHVDIDLIDIGTAIARIGRVDLMKLDCEGAEFQIIKSLNPDTPVARIIWEATPSLYDPTEIANHLASIGYRLTSNAAGAMVTERD